MTKNNYWVSPTENGWKVKREGASRASGIYDTQREAENRARSTMLRHGGGELITQSSHGPIRSKDTINGNDPYPPRDREN